MLDELDDEQRARLCILTTLGREFGTQPDAFDLVRCARWVELGCDPDASSSDGSRDYQIKDISVWSPAVE